jgi:hypothetical protein
MGPFTEKPPTQSLEDFAALHPTSFITAAPPGGPPQGEFKWYLGPRYEREPWNLVLLERAAEQLQRERLASPRMMDCLPPVDNAYICAIFMNFLKAAVTGLNRSKPRAGESSAAALTRAEMTKAHNQRQALQRSRRKQVRCRFRSL